MLIGEFLEFLGLVGESRRVSFMMGVFCCELFFRRSEVEVVRVYFGLVNTSVCFLVRLGVGIVWGIGGSLFF